MTVLDNIKFCEASDIVKNTSPKKHSLFNSTSVLDLVKLDNEEVIIKYLLPRKSLAKKDWQPLLDSEVEKLKVLQFEENNELEKKYLVKIKGYVKEIHFERRNNIFPGLLYVNIYNLLLLLLL